MGHLAVVQSETTEVLDLRDACCPRCTALARAARDLADLMGLRDWIVEIGHAPPGRGRRATAEMPPHRKLIRIRVGEEFERLPSDERRHTLVHELAHALVRDLYETAAQSAQAAGVRGVRLRMLKSEVRREAERAVDVVACVLAPHLPLVD